MQNLERNWLVISKLREGIWQIWAWALKSLKNFQFNGLVSSKVYIWAKKVQRSYLLWNWKGIQNLERNQLAVLKLAEEIWQISTWILKSLKYFHFNGLILGKVYIVWAAEVQRSYLHDTEEICKCLKNNWLVVWKKTWEIWQIFTTALESVKVETLMGSFCPKEKRYDLKICRGVMCHDNEE